MNNTDSSVVSLSQGHMLEEQTVISDQLKAGIARPQLLLWQYATPAIIMGCSQRPDAGQQQRAEQAGMPLMRRGSGGGAVLAGPWMLSVTLFIPPEHTVAALNIIEIFSWFEAIWIKALRDCGVPCKGVDQPLIEASKARSKRHGVEWACYASLSHGEVVSPDGRKLVGLAQIRKRKGIALVSGVHLAPCDWGMLSKVVVDDGAQGEILEALNSDAQQLSGRQASDLLPELLRAFTAALPADFEVLVPVLSA